MDVHYDEETGDEWYDNYRWEFMSADIGERAPGLDPGPEYPQRKWYSVYEYYGTIIYSFSVDVNRAGDLVGVGGFPGHATVTALPEPGPDWRWQVYTLIEPYEGEE